MTHQPRVSLIVNNYNYAGYVGAAIDSALSQSYAPVEVIVVDDGSTDGSREVIARFGSRVIPIFKENGGQASAFNAGFARATGDVVLFLDADDTLLPDALATVVPLFSDGSVSKVHWPLRVVDAAGEWGGTLLPPDPLPEGSLKEHVLEVGPDSYLSSPCSGNAWSRRFLERVLPMAEPAYRNGADGYLINFAPLLGRIAAVERPLGCYRVHTRNNFWKATLEERVLGSLQRYEARSASLVEFLTTQGLKPDVDEWRRRNPYLTWLKEVATAISEIKSVIPENVPFILVDENEWGSSLLRDRPATPLMQENGAYWGHPPDDQVASERLIDLKQKGHRFLVVGYPSFWWADHYHRFWDYLSHETRLVHRSERVQVFEL